MKRWEVLGTSNAKTVNGEKLGYYTGISYLAPHTILHDHYNEHEKFLEDRGIVIAHLEEELEGCKTLCPYSTAECRKSCLYYAGRGRMQSVMQARMLKTARYLTKTEEYLSNLRRELHSLIKYAHTKGMQACARLNGTSELPWETILNMEQFPEVHFYDYTKSFEKITKYINGRLPENYHLTFSYTKYSNKVDWILQNGGNIAVVFATHDFPKEFLGREVVDGDLHDLTFLHPEGVVVGLKAKGLAKKFHPKFVQPTQEVVK